MTDGITITRVFDAPRNVVWAAWTAPEQFSVWFGTAAVDVPLATIVMDVRVGGAWSAVMHLPDGQRIDWTGEYIEVQTPQRLAFTMTDDPANPAREPVTVDLAEVDGGTRMTMTQRGGNLTDEQYRQAEAGWNGFFDEMAGLLAA
ncbi:SRPBCC domain-containing protein [uncultured Amnibacterium sp.]|uniref:SRPBCC family protein n=1 Tax=uncultured Amnibacterium sp. TaxID=1631851 RepID=UPI0035CB9B33